MAKKKKEGDSNIEETELEDYIRGDYEADDARISNSAIDEILSERDYLLCVNDLIVKENKRLRKQIAELEGKIKKILCQNDTIKK